MEQAAAEEMGAKVELGRVGVTRIGLPSGLVWLVPALHLPCRRHIPVFQSRLSGLAPGPLQYPLIGLHLFVSPSHLHTATTAADSSS